MAECRQERIPDGARKMTSAEQTSVIHKRIPNPHETHISAKKTSKCTATVMPDLIRHPVPNLDRQGITRQPDSESILNAARMSSGSSELYDTIRLVPG